MDDRHEDGSADDRPQDREGLPADVDHEGLRQLELVGDPGSEQGSDEAENHRDDEPAANLPAMALPMAPQMAAMKMRTMSPGNVMVM